MKHTYFHTLHIAAAAAVAAVLLSAPACTLISPVQSEVPIDFSWVDITKTPVERPADMDNFAVWAWLSQRKGETEVFAREQVYWDSPARSWVYDNTRYWDEGTYTFHALHPFAIAANAECTADGGLTISHFTTGSGDIDLMLAAESRTYDPSEPSSADAVAFSFSHLLSRIYILASCPDGCRIDEARISGITLTGSYTCPSASPDGASFWILNEGSEGYFTAKDIELSADGSTHIFPDGLLLIPQNHDGVTLSVTFKGCEPIHLSLPASPAWQAGKSYRYQLTFPTPDSTPTVDITVSDWTDTDVTVDRP